MSRLSVQLIIWLIACYRRSIGIVLPTLCRHYPSCSQYAEEAVGAHGVFAGARLAALRVLRCQPFSRGGYDPVPGPRG